MSVEQRPVSEESERTREAESYLREQWETVIVPMLDFEQCGFAQECIDEIIDAYCDETRAYHNLVHIKDCLASLEDYRDRPDFLQLWAALLLHDVVYDTHATDNEQNSGLLAYTMLDQLGISGADTVQRLIESTKYHDPQNEDEALVCSIDMSILGGSAEQYRAYSIAIRKEYHWVPDDIYARERVKVLKSFELPFSHPDFEHLNDGALQSIADEIAQLS